MKRLFAFMGALSFVLLTIAIIVVTIWAIAGAFPYLAAFVLPVVAWVATETWKAIAKKQENLHEKRAGVYNALLKSWQTNIVDIFHASRAQSQSLVAAPSGDDIAATSTEALLYASRDVLLHYGKLREAVRSNRADVALPKITALVNTMRLDLGAGSKLKLDDIAAIFEGIDDTADGSGGSNILTVLPDVSRDKDQSKAA